MTKYISRTTIITPKSQSSFSGTEKFDDVNFTTLDGTFETLIRE